MLKGCSWSRDPPVSRSTSISSAGGSQPLARDYRASSMVVIVSTQQGESLMSAVDLDKDGGLDESVLSGRGV